MVPALWRGFGLLFIFLEWGTLNPKFTVALGMSVFYYKFFHLCSYSINSIRYKTVICKIYFMINAEICIV
jgi:hypothetical protein